MCVFILSTIMSKRFFILKVKVKLSRYRPGVAQRVVRGIALLFHDRDTRRGWVVSSTPRPHFTSGKDPVPILQEAGWAPGPVLMGGKSRPHRDSIPDRPARSQSLYRLSYRAHNWARYFHKCTNTFTWNTHNSSQTLIENCFSWRVFFLNLKYQISWQSVQWELRKWPYLAGYE